VRIGIVATRLAGVDGVTFETAKWEAVLERMGHDVRLCAGEVDALRSSARLIPAMHFSHPPAARVTAAAFDPESDAEAVQREVHRLADQLLPVLAAWIETERLDALVVENAWAIPMQLPLGAALRTLVTSSGIPTIAHNHDYWWERDRFTRCVIPDLLDEAFPPALPNVRHVSISSLAAQSLEGRRGLESLVVPNVFDFGHPMPRPRPDVRRDLRTELGMGESGLLLVQPTRVVPRKGIELTIDLAGRLDDPEAVVLITSPAGDEGLDYLIALERRAERAKVNLRYAADRFAPDHEGRPIGPAHSLTDAYAAADLIAYPSLYEGFGNALLEAVFFGKPVFVNRYPVYEADIRPLGFRFVEIDGVVTDEAAAAVRAVLADPSRQTADAEHNFAIGKAHLGYDRLEAALATLLAPA
jgi:glycosyltransferase involved in cell wall biosynthesis